MLTATTYAAARQLQPSLSAQAWGLVPRIRDADVWLAAEPRFFECHPETSFRVLTGQVLARKKTAAGALERVAALTAALGAALPTDVPADARLEDALDAAVCAWSAARFATGTARLLTTGDRDNNGRALEIWA